MEDTPVTEVKSSSEQPNPLANDEDHRDENVKEVVPDASTHAVTGLKPEIDEEEVRRILQIIASTGKFWHDWDRLKTMLSFQLKQVLSEYPEAEKTTEEQISSLGETCQELVKRLDEAFNSFSEGPPFTLQRLCEILLDAKSTYTNLSKLALSLEKNLLVTSMLTISTDPYPQELKKVDEQHKEDEESQPETNSVQNGAESKVGDGDEEMSEAEQPGDDMRIDM